VRVFKPSDSPPIRTGGPNRDLATVENQIGGYLGEREQDKTPFFHAGMRQAKPRSGHPQVIEEQDIDIHRSGSQRARAHPPEIRLNRKAKIEQGLRTAPRTHLQDCVEKLRSSGQADRGRGIKR
jgi:hypothetical protein